MKLKSMTDFVLSQKKSKNLERAMRIVYDYAEYMRCTPELWMFVPCDEDGKIMIHENCNDENCNPDTMCDKCVSYLAKYRQAESRVVFDGWFVKEKTDILIRLCDKHFNVIDIKMPSSEIWLFNSKQINTIEDLSKFNLQLKK